MAFQCRRDGDRFGIVKRPPHHLNAAGQPLPGLAAAPDRSRRPSSVTARQQLSISRPVQHLIANPEFGRPGGKAGTEATGMSRIGHSRMNAATSARRASAAVVARAAPPARPDCQARSDQVACVAG